jgi:hypothetical protein
MKRRAEEWFVDAVVAFIVLALLFLLLLPLIGRM